MQKNDTGQNTAKTTKAKSLIVQRILRMYVVYLFFAFFLKLSKSVMPQL